MRSLVVIMLLLAAPALAVAKGEKLYVKTKDTKLLKEPKSKAAAIMTLQPGREVIWNGPSVKDKDWHEVTVDGKKGFLHLIDLTPQRPMHEIATSTGPPINPQAFAASGAGYTTCSFGSSPQQLNGSPAEKETQAELIYLEELNREKATLAVLDEKSRELHRK